ARRWPTFYRVVGGPGDEPMMLSRLHSREWQRLSIWLISAAVTIFLVCYPLARLVGGSFVNDEGQLTLANYLTLFTRRTYQAAIITSFQVALWSTLLSVPFGFPMAWAVSRTNMPLKGWVRNLTFASFITPPYLGSLAWIFLLGPQAGKLNAWLQSLFDLSEAPFNIFSF